VKKSQARIVWAWAVRNCRQVGRCGVAWDRHRPGGGSSRRCWPQSGTRGRRVPRVSGGCPQVGFSAARRRVRSRISRSTGGLPGRAGG
jgi:hypothetical protein